MLRDKYGAIHEYDEDTPTNGLPTYKSMCVYKAEGDSKRYPGGRTKSRPVVIGTMMNLFLDMARVHASTGKLATLRFLVSYSVQLQLRNKKFDMADCFIQFVRKQPFWMEMFPRLRKRVPGVNTAAVPTRTRTGTVMRNATSRSATFAVR